MIEKLIKYISPLRIIGIWMLIWAIVEYIDTERIIEQGYEPGLGGLGYLALGFVSIIAFGLDIILSLTLNPKKNWIIQIIIVLIFIILITFS